MNLLWLLPLAYLAGSVNFSIILFRLTGKDDPRTSFSGNAGTSNVVRQAGYGWGAGVLMLDIGRAALIMLLAEALLRDASSVLVGCCLLVGNMHPIFHGFKGGKGVATYLGITAVLSPAFALLSCLAWLAVYSIARLVYMSSFVMVTVMAVGAMQSFDWTPPAVAGSLFSLGIIIIAHRTNLRAAFQSRSAE